MVEKPAANVSAILRTAFASLKAADRARIATAIKSANRTDQSDVEELVRLLRKMGSGIIVSDPAAAEVFFNLSETIAIALEQRKRDKAAN